MPKIYRLYIILCCFSVYSVRSGHKKVKRFYAFVYGARVFVVVSHSYTTPSLRMLKYQQCARNSHRFGRSDSLHCNFTFFCFCCSPFCPFGVINKLQICLSINTVVNKNARSLVLMHTYKHFTTKPILVVFFIFFLLGIFSCLNSNMLQKLQCNARIIAVASLAIKIKMRVVYSVALFIDKQYNETSKIKIICILYKKEGLRRLTHKGLSGNHTHFTYQWQQ